MPDKEPAEVLLPVLLRVPAFLIFTNAISNFENQLNKTDYKQEDVKLLVFQTKNKLKNLYQDISVELDRVEQLSLIHI